MATPNTDPQSRLNAFPRTGRWGSLRVSLADVLRDVGAALDVGLHADATDSVRESADHLAFRLLSVCSYQELLEMLVTSVANSSAAGAIEGGGAPEVRRQARTAAHVAFFLSENGSTNVPRLVDLDVAARRLR